VSSHLSDHALLVENAKALAPDMAWNPGSPQEGLLQRKYLVSDFSGALWNDKLLRNNFSAAVAFTSFLARAWGLFVYTGL
jgi:hypothetical protein